MATQRFQLDLRCLGMTETERFNQNYIHPTLEVIEVKNVRRNPKNKRVFFVEVANSKVLSQLISKFDHEPIEPNHITHNTFAVYNYQLSEIK